MTLLRKKRTSYASRCFDLRTELSGVATIDWGKFTIWLWADGTLDVELRNSKEILFSSKIARNKSQDPLDEAYLACVQIGQSIIEELLNEPDSTNPPGGKA
jgi:hypothetical protein